MDVKGTMALDDSLHASALLQSVDVLGVVPQQLALLVQHGNELMTWGRLKLAGVNFLANIFLKHTLEIAQYQHLLSKIGRGPLAALPG